MVLIGWVLIGGVFQSDPLPLEATEVSVISGADFEALMAGRQSPSSVVDVAQPPQPDLETDAPAVPAPADPVAEASAPQIADTPPADDVPDVTQLAPPPDAEVADVAPEALTPPEETAVLVPDQAEQAVPEASERIAPEPVARPDPEAAPDPVQQDAVREADTGETAQDTQEATAPEEAAEEIVTEAEKPASAPLASLRPPARRPTPPVAAPAAQTQTADQNSTDTDAAVQAALEAAMSATSDAPAAASGPPLSAGEKDALRVAVSSCWNVGSLSSDALSTTVTVGVSLSQDGKPITASIKMLSAEGGATAAAKQAYEAARRAIIRCGASGYNLPADKYDQWKDIEMTFNPERMRIK